MISSAVICAAMLGLSYEQRHELGHSLEALAALRTARAELAHGALDVVAGPASANTVRHGLQRIRQAVDALERSEASLPQTFTAAEAAERDAVRRQLLGAETRIVAGSTVDAAAEATLVAAVAALERRAATFDASLLAELQDATAKADVTFRVALAASLILLGLMAVTIFIAERGLLAVFRDWREADHEMVAVFDSLPALIWFKDRSNRIRRVNAVAASVAGRTVEDIEGRPADEVFALQATNQVAEDQAVLASDLPRLGALEHLTLSPEHPRWYRIDRVPYHGVDGQMDGVLVVARDVTEQKAADDATLDERNRLTAVAAAAPTVICSFREAPDGTMSFPYASPRIVEIYGLTPADLRVNAAVVADLWHPDDRARLAASVAASKRAMTPWRDEFRVHHPTKGEIWVEGHSVPFADPDGGVTWHGSLTDVTERRRVQQELEAREELLAETGAIARIGGWELDLTTGRGRWTAEVARIHDVDPAVEPSLAMGLDFYPGPARAQVEAAVQGALAGTPFDIEVPFVSAKGVKKWVRTSGRLVARDGHGALLRGAIHDITDRKEAEVAVQDRLAMEQRLSMLAANSPAVMYSFRLGPDGAMNFPYASQRFGELFGVAAEELVISAEPALSRIHQDDLPRVMTSIQQSAIAGEPWIQELRFLHPTRGLVWVEGRSTPTRQPDGATVWYGTLLDVTDRHQLEAELRQSQKLEAIGRLAGGVAHDFNNLLTVILGNATEMADGVTSGEEVQEIINASERAANLTKQLLLFSRKQVMQQADLDLNTVVGDTIRMLQRILGEDIALRPALASRLPLIHADKGMMEQLLLNLAVNARDAMPHGGELFVSTRVSAAASFDPHRPTDLEPMDYVCVVVRDTGTGISPDILPRIFEPFYTTKEPGKGTGLGLATVYGIVKQHGGGVSVESTVGEGTTFTVYLPVGVRAEAGAEAEPAESVVRGGRDECILVVEDEPAVRELAARVLQRDGYRVLTATSGPEALSVWNAHRGEVALLITDLVMPGGMSGLVLAERITRSRPDLPTIFTSGYSRELSAGAVSLEPGVDFLAKPYRTEDLLAIVRRRLDSDAPVRPPARVAQA